jgi:predicted transcriptional regulator
LAKGLNAVTLSVADRATVNTRALAAVDGKAQGNHISFASADLLWSTLTKKRWELLQIMTGSAPISIREVARRAERDVKAVHSDIHALLSAGIIDRTGDGRVHFPYDAVHVDFMLTKAA